MNIADENGHVTTSSGSEYVGNSTITIRTCPWPNGPCPRAVQPAGPYVCFRKPHCCPVCGGRGTVRNAGYGGGSTYTGDAPCHACAGSGIVWG